MTLVIAAADARADNRLMRMSVSLLGGVLGLLAAVQAVVAFKMRSLSLRGAAEDPLLDVLLRVSITFVTITIAVALIALVRPEHDARGRRAVAIIGIALITAVVRCALQLLGGVYPVDAWPALVMELLVGVLVVGLICLHGVVLVDLSRRLRDKEREKTRARLQVVEALQALQQEELRVRREVAHGLHGRLQNGLVVLAAELHALAAAEGPPRPERLAGLAARLDLLREVEVRAASADLYPVDAEHGLLAATRGLLARLPPEIAVTLDIDDAWAEHEARSLALDQRVLLVRVVEEAITNALKHGGARSVALRFAVEPGVVAVSVEDDGSGVAGAGPRSGLARLAAQLEARGGALDLAESGTLGGARLAARLPVEAR
ncbi:MULTISPECIES: sensor histidine kinase [unclassified Rathayibacter]|uniref:sensor histidine kinase n=1 Tax=unclassified Rathayibacter TaxID=2609250 RepID=UPI00188A3C54|nr:MULTISPECIES: ATP-binding protein [unclassified Rathayibacter]MBF4461248.1 hypothetical protein [Rathayibacter sp. VKM Ac-2879]MBF4502659.1 hypothetical protein [Rathayibacter sp. VKM Ac-2878]